MKDKIQKNLINEIKSGKAKMKPRSYFIFRKIAFWFTIFVVIIISFYITSFGFFVLRAGGLYQLPYIGFKILPLILVSIPWMIVLLFFVFLILFEYLLKRSPIIYKHSLIYSILILIIIFALGGVILAESGVHDRLYDSSKDEGLGVFGSPYRGINNNRPKDLNFGKVLEINDDSILIELEDGNEATVIISKRTKGFIDCKKSDCIISVLGELKDGEIEALGVKVVNKKRFFQGPKRLINMKRNNNIFD